MPVGCVRQAKIIVFAKAPVAGRVKTRLVPYISGDEAAKLHQFLTEHTIRVATESELCPVQLWCSPDIHHDFFTMLKSQYPITLHQQQGNDLGAKMAHAFSHVLQTSDQAVIVGTDCPAINALDYENAFHHLSELADATIMPALDGGYTMLGLKTVQAELFEGIRWGSDEVYESTLSKLENLNWNWQTMSKRHDIDRAEDLRQLAHAGKEYALSDDFIHYLHALDL